MSFFEWRRLNFFDLKQNADSGNISRALEGTSITATSSGNGKIVICDSEGCIHILNRNFHVTTFQGYLVNVSLAEQLKSLSILVTIGEDEPGINPIVKIWDLEKKDRQGNPICMKTFRTAPNNQLVPTSALCISDHSNMMAVGFANGAIILYRGNLTRDRGMKPTLLRKESDPITGLAFKSVNRQTYLFATTTNSVLKYSVIVKDREKEFVLDEFGCAKGCFVLADSIHDYPVMVARDDAIYCYTVDGRGPCYAVDGKKVFLQWFRTYLIIVAEDTDENPTSPITVSSTTSSDENRPSNGSYVVTVLDIQNKFIVFTTVLQEIVAVLPEWGSFYILTKNYSLHHFLEKDLQSKLNLLFRKNLYDVSIRIAKSQQYDTDSLIDIFRQYGDHLYGKGDHNGAVEQYIKTIGKLEPSYVIRKFLDSQYIDNLIKYLSALHKQGVATGDHTTLLLNCYTKLNNVHKLKEFILTKDRDIDFDLNIAISVCRKSSSEDALILAEKHGLHLWYIKILLEDHHKYSAALQYIAKLEFTEAYEMVKKFGGTLIQHIPDEFTEFLKKLCTSYDSNSDLLRVDQDENNSTYQANPHDFIHLLLNNSTKMVEFLEFLIQYSSKREKSVYNTLIEHYLHVWFNSNDSTTKSQYSQKIMNTLQSSEANYDKNQALILCTMRNFKSGILYLLEENKLSFDLKELSPTVLDDDFTLDFTPHKKMYKQILKYQLGCGNYQEVLTSCRRFGYQEPSLWIKALTAATEDPFFPSSILCEILTVIEKLHLLSPVQLTEMISKSNHLTIGDVRSYYSSVLKNEIKLIEEESNLIEEYKQNIDVIHEQVRKIHSSPILFQGSRCNACNNHLELPSVHFLCQHSFHQDCFQSLVENENDCPSCLPNNKKILDKIRSQEQNRGLNETFHSLLERSDDCFSLISNYFGRNVFSKITVDPKLTKKLQKPIRITNRINEKKNVVKYGSLKTENALSTETEKVLSTAKMIKPTSVKNNLVLSPEEGSLTRAIEKEPSKLARNPFDDEYDDDLNPFNESPEQDDYDRSLNPFAS